MLPSLLKSGIEEVDPDGVVRPIGMFLAFFVGGFSSLIGAAGARRWGSGIRGSAVISDIGFAITVLGFAGDGAGDSSGASVMGEGIFIIMNLDLKIAGGGRSVRVVSFSSDARTNGTYAEGGDGIGGCSSKDRIPNASISAIAASKTLEATLWTL
jgi:hypothetical protein